MALRNYHWHGGCAEDTFHKDFINVQHAETLLAPELEQARKRRRIWLVMAVLVLVALGVAAVEYRTVYGWVQSLRARRMAAKAESALLAGNLEQAAGKAKTAYQIKPSEPAAIRVAAKVQDSRESSRCLSRSGSS